MVSLDYDRLVEEAQRREGAELQRSTTFTDGMRLLSEDVNRPGLLTDAGERLLQVELLRVLTQRIRFECFAADYVPSNVSRRVTLIAGVPRAKSTWLHNMLADIDSHDWISYWRALEPFPLTSDGETERTGRAERQLEFMRLLSPSLLRLHPMRVDRPEECISLMQLCGASYRWTISLPVPGYADWLQRTATLTSVYREYDLLLRMLFPTSTRLLLKAPCHSLHIDEFLRVFPSTEILWLTRPQREVDESFRRLVRASRQVFCERIDDSDWADRWDEISPPAHSAIVPMAEVTRLVESLADKTGRKRSLPDHSAWLQPTPAELRSA